MVSVAACKRIPATQAEFAKTINVHETTLSDWKKLPGFMAEVTAIAREQLRDALSDVYGALVKRALADLMEYSVAYDEDFDHLIAGDTAPAAATWGRAA